MGVFAVGKGPRDASRRGKVSRKDFDGIVNGGFKLFRCYLLGADLLNFLERDGGGLSASGTLGLKARLENAIVVNPESIVGAGVISQAFVRSNSGCQPGSKASPTQNVIHNTQGIVVRVIASGSKMANHNASLVHVGFVDHIDSGLGNMSWLGDCGDWRF